MEKRTAPEKEKYQPSYDTTILTEVLRKSFGREQSTPGVILIKAASCSGWDIS